jgi:hypothetical protein
MLVHSLNCSTASPNDDGDCLFLLVLFPLAELVLPFDLTWQGQEHITRQYFALFSPNCRGSNVTFQASRTRIGTRGVDSKGLVELAVF